MARLGHSKQTGHGPEAYSESSAMMSLTLVSLAMRARMSIFSYLTYDGSL